MDLDYMIHDEFYEHFCKTIVYGAIDGSNKNENHPINRDNQDESVNPDKAKTEDKTEMKDNIKKERRPQN